MGPSMKCWRMNKLGDPWALLKMEELDLPPAEGDQIKISVEAADLNFADILQCQGRYQVKLDPPFTPGMTAAGKIIECSPHSKFRIGERVCGPTFSSFGGFAQEALLDESQCQLIPKTVPSKIAAALHVTYSTAWFALKRRGSLQSGETILILAGAGGVGSAAIEIAKNLGSWIIAAASDSRKLQACKELGADEIINYEEEDLYDRVMDLTDNRGVDVVYDPVGGRFFDPARRTVAWEGRYLVIGFANGEIPKAPLNHALVKNYSIVGVHMGGYRYNKPQPIEDCFEELYWQATAGDINPLIDRTVAINALPAALEDLANRKSIGRLVLDLTGEKL